MVIELQLVTMSLPIMDRVLKINLAMVFQKLVVISEMRIASLYKFPFLKFLFFYLRVVADRRVRGGAVQSIRKAVKRCFDGYTRGGSYFIHKCGPWGKRWALRWGTAS